MIGPKLLLIVTPDAIVAKRLAVAKAEAEYVDYVRACEAKGTKPELGRSIPRLMARLDLTAAKRSCQGS